MQNETQITNILRDKRNLKILNTSVGKGCIQESN